jgi:hypothetical protein
MNIFVAKQTKPAAANQKKFHPETLFEWFEEKNSKKNFFQGKSDPEKKHFHAARHGKLQNRVSKLKKSIKY